MPSYPACHLASKYTNTHTCMHAQMHRQWLIYFYKELELHKTKKHTHNKDHFGLPSNKWLFENTMNRAGDISDIELIFRI